MGQGVFNKLNPFSSQTQHERKGNDEMTTFSLKNITIYQYLIFYFLFSIFISLCLSRSAIFHTNFKNNCKVSIKSVLRTSIGTKIAKRENNHSLVYLSLDELRKEKILHILQLSFFQLYSCSVIFFHRLVKRSI